MFQQHAKENREKLSVYKLCQGSRGQIYWGCHTGHFIQSASWVFVPMSNCIALQCTALYSIALYALLIGFCSHSSGSAADAFWKRVDAGNMFSTVIQILFVLFSRHHYKVVSEKRFALFGLDTKIASYSSVNIIQQLT